MININLLSTDDPGQLEAQSDTLQVPEFEYVPAEIANEDSPVVDTSVGEGGEVVTEEVAAAASSAKSFDIETILNSPIMEYWWVLAALLVGLLFLWLLRSILIGIRMRQWERSPFATIEIGHQPNVTISDNTIPVVDPASAMADEAVDDFAQVDEQVSQAAAAVAAPLPDKSRDIEAVEIAKSLKLELDATQQEVRNSRQDLVHLERKVSQLEGTLQHSRTLASELESSKNKLLTDLEQSQAKNTELAEDVSKLHAELESDRKSNQDLTQQLTDTKASLQESIENAKQQSEEFEASISELNDQQAGITNAKMQAEIVEAASRAKLRAASEKLGVVETERGKLATELEQAKAQLAKAGEVDAKLAKLKSINRVLEEKNEEYQQTLQQQAKGFEEQVESKVKAANVLAEKLQEENKQLAQALEAAECQTKQAEQKQAELQSKFEQTDQLGSQLEQARQTIEQQKSDIEKHQTTVKELNNLRKTADAQAEKHQSLLASLAKTEQQLAELNRANEQAAVQSEQQRKAREQELEKSNADRQSLSSQLKAAEQELDQFRQQLTTEKSRAEQLQQQQAKFDKLSKTNDELVAKVAQQTKTTSELEAKLDQREQRIRDLQARLNSLSVTPKPAISNGNGSANGNSNGNGKQTTSALSLKTRSEKFPVAGKPASNGSTQLDAASTSNISNGSTKVNSQRIASNGKPDDLRKIEGIGPKIAQLLKENGIATYQQLASASQEQLKKILTEAGSRFKMHSPASWPQQAKLAAAGKLDDAKRAKVKASV